MNKNILYWSIGILIIIIAFLYLVIFPASVGTTPTTPIVSNSPTTGTVQTTNPKNAIYIVEGKPVALVNGVSIVPLVPGGSTKVITQYFGNETTGDLNEDGIYDTAFILTQNTGGSGTFYYAVVALKAKNGALTGTNAFLLGDRIAPQTLQIVSGQLVVNYVDRKVGEPMTTAPSVAISKYLSLMGNQLKETANVNATTVIYKNTDYGFTFTFPVSWKGYSIVKSTWTGTPIKNVTALTGVKLLMRNPKWSATTHYEDIPVLIFTTAQWKSYLKEDSAISAAPILATELAHNNRYVFALPPRWDFDYSTGFKEAQDIVAGNPLKAFDL